LKTAVLLDLFYCSALLVLPPRLPQLLLVMLMMMLRMVVMTTSHCYCPQPPQQQ
jgi:hypothetical protein